MQQKKLVQLLGVLAVLLLLAWTSGFFDAAPSTVDTPEISVDLDEVESIEIRKGGERVVLARADGLWMLTEPIEADVDTTTRSTFLRSIGDLTIESLITSRPEGHERYQVDSAQSTYLRFASGDAPVELYVGKSGPDFQSKYIRIGDDDRVFLATGVPTAQTSVDRWRNKTIWTFPEASISEVAVSTPESAYTLKQGDGGWVVEEDGATVAADSAKTVRYLSRIATVRADGFLMGLGAPEVADSVSHRIQVMRVDGSLMNIDIWSRDADAAAIASGLDDIVKLNSYRVRNLAPASSEIKPD